MALTALTSGRTVFLLFQWVLGNGLTVDEARNSKLLLMAIFENVNLFSRRSETRSAFRHSVLRSNLLLAGTVVA